MKQPIKCKCGKMIKRPKSNKSGLCYSCLMNEIESERKVKTEFTIMRTWRERNENNN